MNPIGGGWDEALRQAFEAPSYQKLQTFLRSEYDRETVYPHREDIYAALRLTPMREVRAVILGQDPYHEPGQAHGLAFSVMPPCPIPPSLRNIFRELTDEGEMTAVPDSGRLTGWAEQGVLLLNTVLTVRAHQANAHRGKGWEAVTDAVISAVDALPQPVVFLLWGANAGKKAALLHNPDHLVLSGPHPSPLSAYRGFFGCGHFRAANDFLRRNGSRPIDWNHTV